MADRETAKRKTGGKKDRRVPGWAVILFAVVAPAGVLLLTEALARDGLGSVWEWIRTFPLAACANYMLWFIPINALQCIRRRSWFWACEAALLLLFAGLAVGNHFKLQFRTTPVVLGDMTILPDAFSIAREYLPGLNIPLLIMAAALIVLGFAAVVILLLRKYVAGTLRFVLFGLALAFTVFAAHGLKWAWSDGYSIQADYLLNGFAVGFVRHAGDSIGFSKEPDGYDAQSVREAAASAGQNTGVAAPENPNIIVILGEAVMDTDLLPGVAFLDDPMPVIHRAMDGCASGYVTVCVQGGGTCDSEARALTGLELKDYYSISTQQRYIPSLAAHLKQSGYRTHALHSYHGWFYNRYDAMRLLGFDDFICLSAMDNTPGVYGAFFEDAALYRETAALMAETDGADFCYVATMETHGGYGYDMEDGNWFGNDFTGETRQCLNTYFSILHHADSALGAFLDELAAWDEPVVVVYFGDHIPSLGASVFAETQFDVTQPEGFLTPYFIWSNYGLTAADQDMPLCRLGAYTLSLLGLNDDPYLRLADASLSDDVTDEKDRNRDLIAYDLLHGDQHYLALEGIEAANDGYRVGHALRMDSIEATRVDDHYSLAIRGDHLTDKYVLAVNEKEYPLAYDGEVYRAYIPTQDLSNTGEYRAEVLVKDSYGNVINRSEPAFLRFG